MKIVILSAVTPNPESCVMATAPLQGPVISKVRNDFDGLRRTDTQLSNTIIFYVITARIQQAGIMQRHVDDGRTSEQPWPVTLVMVTLVLASASITQGHKS